MCYNNFRNIFLGVLAVIFSYTKGVVEPVKSPLASDCVLFIFRWRQLLERERERE